MKKFFVSLLVSMFAICAIQAQDAFFESVNNIASKLGVDVTDASSVEKMMQYCRMFVAQGNALVKEETPAAFALQRTSQRENHNAFTNRVRLPDVSKRKVPKYYYLKNVATGEYLTFRSPGSDVNDPYESPLYTVETPDENSKFYFIPGTNMLGYCFYLANDNCGNSSYVFHGPATNVWKYPSETNKPRFYFNLADDNSGFYISDGAKSGKLSESGIIDMSIGNVWTCNDEGQIVTVAGEVRPEAIWVAEALPEPYGDLSVAVEPYENSQIVWYVLKNVGDSSYLHYEGNGNVMKTVAAPDTCSLFYGVVGADGKLKLHNCVTGGLECAGVSEWAEDGVSFEILPIDEDKDGSVYNDTRFVVSMADGSGKWAVKDGELVVSTAVETAVEAMWELERISNLKEIFGGSANSGKELVVETAVAARDALYSNDVNLSEMFAAVAAVFVLAANISHEMVCENVDDMRLFMSYPQMMANYARGAGRVLKYSGIYNADRLNVNNTTGEVAVRGLATNSSSLITNELSAVVTDPKMDVLEIVPQLDHLHTNVWEVRATGFYDYGNLSLNDEDIKLYFYNAATKMYISAPRMNENGEYVVEMTSNRYNAGYYKFDEVSIQYEGRELSEIMNIIKGYYSGFRLRSYNYNNVYITLAGSDALDVKCVYTTSPEDVTGIDWVFVNYTPVIDDRVYNHAADAVAKYPQLLQEKYGLAADCDYYSTNAPSVNADHSICNLIDKDYSTVFWTNVSGNAKQYIQADFGEDNAVSEFYFYMKPNLDTPYNMPVSITIEGSNSEDSGFVTLAENVEMPNMLYNMYYFSGLVNEDGNAYRYIRFTVNAVNGGENMFTLSEFHIYPNVDDVALAKQEFDAFYAEDRLKAGVVPPANILMMRKAEYLLEINAPGEMETPDEKYTSLQDAVVLFDANRTQENADMLLIALEDFEGSQNNPVELPVICIVESAWDGSFAAGKALSVDLSDGEVKFQDANIWDIRQWIKLDKYGVVKNVYTADIFAACGAFKMPVEIVHIPGWNNWTESGRHAYSLRNYGASYYIGIGQNDDGSLIVTESEMPITPESNQNGAWYLNHVSDTPVEYVADPEFIAYLAEFGKTMAQAKYYNDNEQLGRLVYISEDPTLTKAGFDMLYESLNYYYSKGPAEVVRMYQHNLITAEIGMQIMSNIEAITRHFPNFLFHKGYFRLRSQASGNYVASQPTGEFTMANNKVGDAELKSIFYTTPSADLQGANVISYEDGRYLRVDAGSLKYDRVPEYGKNSSWQNAFASLVNGVAGFYNEDVNYYLVDGGASVAASSLYSSSQTYKWNMEFVDKLPVVISSAKFATFYSPMELQIPAGVTAYVLYGEGKSNGFDYNISTGEVIAQDVNVFNVAPVEGGVLPAAMPVILHAESAGTYYFKINYTPTIVSDEAREATYNGGNADVVNLLQGRHEATYIPEVENCTHYVLANKDKGVGMYKVILNSSHTSKDGVVTSFATPSFYNNAHRAWLPMPNSISQRANGYLFSLGRNPGTTDIEENVAVEVAEDVIYDLQGRRLNSITVPGVYIVNGKRVFVK